MIINADPCLDAKREQAVAYLGDRCVLSPNYRCDPRHSTDPLVYNAARQPFLAQIRQAAERDRAVNPAFVRAQKLARLLAE